MNYIITNMDRKSFCVNLIPKLINVKYQEKSYGQMAVHPRPKTDPHVDLIMRSVRIKNIFREGFVKEYLMGFIFTKVLFLKRVIRGVSRTTVSRTSKIEFFAIIFNE